MKKKRRIIILLCSIFLLAALVVSYFTLPFCVFSTTESCVTYDKNNSVISVDGDSIKVLQITDLHVNGALDMPFTFTVIKTLVRRTAPDMIVVTGDVFSSGCSEGDVDTFLDFMDRLGLPWAAVLGNHDDETPYSLAELSAMLEDAEGSLFKSGDLTDLYGNYFYNVEFSDGGRHKFIFMDSRSRGFTDESVAFYEDAVTASPASDGSLVDSFLFYHIPLTETVTAIDEYESGRSVGTGKRGETVCDQSTEVGFFDKVVELGSTRVMIYGHDHFNNVKTNYCGVDFNYGVKTGTSAGNSMWLVGGTLYTLNSSGEYTVEDIILP